MAKKKQKQVKKSEKKEDKPTLFDHLDQSAILKLKEKKTQLKEQQVKQEEEEAERKKEERRQREKNKSFEDLLNESELDWKKFK
jgi:hypothetical protein